MTAQHSTDINVQFNLLKNKMLKRIVSSKFYANVSVDVSDMLHPTLHCVAGEKLLSHLAEKL